MKKRFLVPIDFSEVTENALQHAKAAALSLDADLVLLHLIESESERSKAEAKLKEWADRYTESGWTLEPIVRKGNIDDIGPAAAEYGCGLIYMGTHGLRGMQYLLGSRALRVVSGSAVPFVITHGGRPRMHYRNIVVPMDMQIEEKQVLTAVAGVAKAMNAQVHLLGADYTDEFLKNKVTHSVAFARNYLRNQGVAFTIQRTEPDAGILESVLEFATDIDADLIAIINHHEDGVKNLIGGGFDQKLITNEAHIPVLVVNSKRVDSHVDIFSMFAS
ncbi:hypothetical protein GC167_08585 [bacterium]|nr:hypothetical protein [bacterium]